MASRIKDGMKRNAGVTYRILEKSRGRGHEVVLAEWTVQTPDGGKASGKMIYCECDFPKSARNNPYNNWTCPDKWRFREKLIARIRRKHGAAWKAVPLKEAIMDVYVRHNRGEYLGQSYCDIIYVQEVAKILGVSEQEVRVACDELFADDRLQLNGCVLADWEPGFRFPDEFRRALGFLDGGEFDLEEVEEAITRGTDLKHGRDAFGSEEYPHLGTDTLLSAGAMWLQLALERLHAENDAVQLDRARKLLHELIVRTHGTPVDD